jgi:hypothetical protein
MRTPRDQERRAPPAMSTRSIISGLPAIQKAALDHLIRSSDYAGVDRLHAAAGSMGVEVSRSAFARYVKQLREGDGRQAGPTLVLVVDSRAGKLTLIPTELSGAEVVDVIPGARRSAVEVPGIRVRPPSAAHDERAGGDTSPV